MSYCDDQFWFFSKHSWYIIWNKLSFLLSHYYQEWKKSSCHAPVIKNSSQFYSLHSCWSLTKNNTKLLFFVFSDYDTIACHLEKQGIGTQILTTYNLNKRIVEVKTKGCVSSDRNVTLIKFSFFILPDMGKCRNIGHLFLYTPFKTFRLILKELISRALLV